MYQNKINIRKCKKKRGESQKRSGNIFEICRKFGAVYCQFEQKKKKREKFQKKPKFKLRTQKELK